jgi:hypothetical protein
VSVHVVGPFAPLGEFEANPSADEVLRDDVDVAFAVSISGTIVEQKTSEATLEQKVRKRQMAPVVYP